MGGIFGVASKNSCTLDLFFGVDYHSHLGTKRGGMAVYGSQGFTRSIHNIENTPFRTKFDGDLDELEGTLGIGCISDNEPQPLLIQSHLGSFAITTVGKINNEAELVASAYENGHIHFMEMSHGRINATELVHWRRAASWGAASMLRSWWLPLSTRNPPWWKGFFMPRKK